MDKEYRIDIKVRNNIILTKIEHAGHKSIPKFCKEYGVTYGRLLDVINMTEPAHNKDGSWNKAVLKTANALNCSPENLFTEQQLTTQLKTNKREIQVQEAEMRFMLESTDNQKLLEDHYLDGQLEENIHSALRTLTPREQKVISMRMGLGEYKKEYTFDEVGEEFGISRERVRQIEAKALRKLRHPSRSDNLRDFLENEE